MCTLTPYYYVIVGLETEVFTKHRGSLWLATSLERLRWA